MSATYDETLPTDKDVIRSMLGDIDTANALHSDEHIAAVLVLQGSVNAGIVYLANELIARYAQEPVKVTIDDAGGQIVVDYTERLKIWRAIVSTAQSGINGGGISFVPASYGVDATDEYSRL